jgi:N6-L-threonylcarbamoyladenine synthase
MLDHLSLKPAQSEVILAIESSCDETSAAVVRDGVVLSNIIASQAEHEAFGGVVPEMASRAHVQHIVPVVDTALNVAGANKAELTAVAFTQAPGLIGSLMVGSNFAKGLAMALQVPLIAVNHMQAHVLSHFIEDPRPSFPFLNLTVSGGHTQIVLVRDYLDMQVLGETIDDAAGEAFDKTAKMLGLPYPGGPLIDRYAKDGDPLRFKFPISDLPGYDFSFSGIKTSILYFLQKQTKLDPEFVASNLHDICASVQYTIIQSLLLKLARAAKELDIRDVGIAGGVSANSGLRVAVTRLGEESGWRVFIPAFQYCTDNGAMIGMTAHFKLAKQQFAALDTTPSARSASL